MWVKMSGEVEISRGNMKQRLLEGSRMRVALRRIWREKNSLKSKKETSESVDSNNIVETKSKSKQMMAMRRAD